MGLFGILGCLKKYSIEQAFCLGMFPMDWGIYFSGLGIDRGLIKRIKYFFVEMQFSGCYGDPVRGLL